MRHEPTTTIVRKRTLNHLAKQSFTVILQYSAYKENLIHGTLLSFFFRNSKVILHLAFASSKLTIETLN